jgi:hypothetical protein
MAWSTAHLAADRARASLRFERRSETRRISSASLWESLRAVRDYPSEHAPEAVEPALEAYRRFEP